MSDNPFIEPEDSERTVIRPMPGGRRGAAADLPVGVAEPPLRSAATAVSSDGVETLAMGRLMGSLSLSLRSLADSDPSKRGETPAPEDSGPSNRFNMVRFGVTTTTIPK